jgi:hypothetical protein
MTKISFWAKQHVWTSRLIIIFLIYPVINFCGWFLGDVLALSGVYFNQSWGYVLSFVILFLFLVYPYKADKTKPYYRVWKKSIDALMILTTFAFILVRGNGFNNDRSPNIFMTAAYASVVAEPNIDPKTKIEKKKKNAIKKLVQNIRTKYKSLSRDEKTGLIIFVIIVAVVALYGLLALSCSIACSGSEGLAYAVFFLGLGGLIFGTVRIIQRIKKGPRKKKEPKMQSS